MKENEKYRIEIAEVNYNLNKDVEGLQMYREGYLMALQSLGMDYVIKKDGTLKIFGGVGSIDE